MISVGSIANILERCSVIAQARKSRMLFDETSMKHAAFKQIKLVWLAT
ncbi:Hypothetical protein Cul131001_0559 [Corynebacterium ulcerans]|nr:Hypothetical protein Cul05146_0566 [Corynebacterium ulcerans]ALD94284.1 Hypothetical protein Cul131001_0559 [Corynebacterium ulcerans]